MERARLAILPLPVGAPLLLVMPINLIPTMILPMAAKLVVLP
jgi:hypothetical protein